MLIAVWKVVDLGVLNVCFSTYWEVIFFNGMNELFTCFNRHLR